MTKCDGETSLIPFLKKSKLSIYPDQQPKILLILFYCMSKVRATEIY